jgi:hypothetical protein
MPTGNATHAGWTTACAITVLIVGAAAALTPPAPASSTETIAQARHIRADVNARLRSAPGRKLVVTEATSTAVVRSLTLVEPGGLRVVPADNGIYFATCSTGARCPYPRRSQSWPATAFAPRRLALELALRTLLETSASLVIVLLPTVEPVWVLFERDDVLRSLDASSVLARLVPLAGGGDAALRKLVDGLIAPRLFAPIPIVPPPDDTIFALRLEPPEAG